jgi:hypothetical protein
MSQRLVKVSPSALHRLLNAAYDQRDMMELAVKSPVICLRSYGKNQTDLRRELRYLKYSIASAEQARRVKHK